MGRLGIVAGILAVLAGIVTVRLFFLQVSRADEYRTAAAQQHAVQYLSLPKRGNIFFEDKEGVLIPAAITRQTFILEGNPRRMENPQRAYDILSEFLLLEQDKFIAQAAADSTYVVFARDISRDAAATIAQHEIPGIWLSGEDRRSYPEGATASHALGFVGFVHDARAGRYGVEQQYDGLLRGTSGKYAGERSRKLTTKKEDGRDLILTIDPHVQSLANTIAADLMERWQAVSVGILVLDPQTGAIRAMESLPAFNPNAYGDVKDYEVFLNPFTQKVFEMGSIVKPLTMAAGLDARAITEETTYYDAGTLKMGDATIGNYDGKGRGQQKMYDILDQSLNTGTVFIMQQLGTRAFRDYMDRFGLGSNTGIDLPQEIAGNLRNLDTGREVEYATASFGQGIAVTPVGLASALAAVANGGELMRPYVMQRIQEGDTVIEETKPVVHRRVLKEESSEAVSRMLSNVVDKTLAGGAVAIPGYHIAAKTGTAQIPKKGASGYSDAYLHAFFGYAPAFDPQFLILLYMEQPQGMPYASQTLSEPFRKLTEFMISYYEIPPDRKGARNP